MPTQHVVKQGDSVARLAAIYGLAPETIWNDTANNDLRELRKDMNVLLDGDAIVIPDKNLSGRACVTAKRHVFRRKGVPMPFRVQLLDESQPRKQLAYVLEIDRQRWEGATDDHGALEHYIPNVAGSGTLTLDGGAVIPLRFGYMDPLSTFIGVQKRLANLGFPCGGSGEWDAMTAKAVRAFQRTVGLEASGDLDDATRGAIGDCHDQRGKLAEMVARAKAAAKEKTA